MPNWCACTLIVKGQREILENFAAEAYHHGNDEVNETPFSFEKFLPTPPELMKNQGWYDWRVKNWGTKWDACEVSFDTISETEIIYNFDTAWGPPVELFTFIAAMYPTLHFDLNYDIEGGNGAGDLYWFDGELGAEDARENFYTDEDEDDDIEWP